MRSGSGPAGFFPPLETGGEKGTSGGTVIDCSSEADTPGIPRVGGTMGGSETGKRVFSAGLLSLLKVIEGEVEGDDAFPLATGI